MGWHRRWRRRRNLGVVANRVPNGSSSRAANARSSGNSVDVGCRSDRRLIENRDAVRNRRRLHDVFARQIRRALDWMAFARGLLRRRSSHRRFQKVRSLDQVQFRRALDPDERHEQQQAQRHGLTSEGCERGPASTGRVIPGAFERVEHDVLRTRARCSKRHLLARNCSSRFDKWPRKKAARGAAFSGTKMTGAVSLFTACWAAMPAWARAPSRAWRQEWSPAWPPASLPR